MVSRLYWLSCQQDNQQQPSNVLEYRVLQLDPSVRLRTLLAWDNFFTSCRTLLCCCCSRVLWSFGRILQQGSWRPSLYSWGTLHVPGNTGVHGSLVAHTGPMHHPSLHRSAIPETWRSHKLMGSLRHTQLPGLQNPACRRIWSSRIFHRPVASQISQNQVGVSH